MKLLLSAAVLLNLVIFSNAYAGKRRSTSCNSLKSTPFAISSIQGESSHRFHVISALGTAGGVPINVDWIEVRDSQGLIVKSKDASSSMILNDAHVEGANFIPGETYSVTVGSNKPCSLPSAPKSVTLLPDSPETNAPLIRDVTLASGFLGATLWIRTSDDTAIESFRVTYNGSPLGNGGGLVAARAWTLDPSPICYVYSDSFLHVNFYISSNNVPGILEVEVVDVYGNISIHTQTMTL